MTTLKSFQAEIEAISTEKHKLAIQQAREAHAAAELARHHGKVPPTKKEAATPLSPTKAQAAATVSNDGKNGDAGITEEEVEIPLEVSSVGSRSTLSRAEPSLHKGADHL